MVYYTTIPVANSKLSVSQPLIQDNFLTANTVMNVNHYPFTDLTDNQGKHRFVEMPVLGIGDVTPVIPSVAVGSGGIFTNTISGNSELFYTPDNSNQAYQLTRTNSAEFSKFSANPGWAFLPGGLIIQWGTNTSASGSTITFPISFTSPPYNIQCTIFQNTTNRHFVYARSSTTSNFVTTQLDSGGSGETNTFSWIAIGK